MDTEEVFIDSKGRILIPKNIREKVGLQTGAKARLKIEKQKLVILPPISPEEFIQEMEGCIKEDTPTIDPLNLKRIWEHTKPGAHACVTRKNVNTKKCSKVL